MSLYPSLEDLEVDKMAGIQHHQQQQQQQAVQWQQQQQQQPQQQPPPYGAYQSPSPQSSSSSLYSGLGIEEFMGNYAGLDIRQQALQSYVPQDMVAQLLSPPRAVSITPVGDKNLAKASIQQGVREVILAKDQSGKLGVVVSAIDKGLFISFVWTGSAASMAGLRFGDQVLQINGQNVAGWDSEKATKFLQKADGARVSFIIRDRPFERVITVIKDSHNHIGFLFKNGEVTAIVKDSSAARNGVLTNHQLTEVNGQNVIGLKDEGVQRILAESPQSVTLTFMPCFLYQHLIKHIGFSKLKKYMDHSIPEY